MREVGADAETIGRRSLQHPITTAALHLQPHSVNVLLVCCFVISCFFLLLRIGCVVSSKKNVYVSMSFGSSQVVQCTVEIPNSNKSIPYHTMWPAVFDGKVRYGTDTG